MNKLFSLLSAPSAGGKFLLSVYIFWQVPPTMRIYVSYGGVGEMNHRDKSNDTDHLATGRGWVIAVLLGVALWIIIISIVYEVWFG